MAPTALQLRIMSGVLGGIGVAITVFRLFIRYKSRLHWWDDFWAAAAAVFTVILITANFLHTQDPSPWSRSAQIGFYYMCIQFYYAVSWSSRLSILCTVIRLSVGRLRSFLIFSSFLFLLAWAILLAQIFWVCERGDTSWKLQIVRPQCLLGIDVASAQIITVVVSDAILVFAPVKLIWRARIPAAVKVRLISVFASTVATTIASLVYIYYVLNKPGILEEYSATVHDGVSLLVANLTVVVGYIFKLLSKSDDASSASHDNTRPIYHEFRLGGKRAKMMTTTLFSTYTARAEEATHVEVHIERGSNEVWTDGASVYKAIDLKAITSGVGSTGSGVTVTSSSMHNLSQPDGKV